MNDTTRELGGTVGVAVIGSVFSSVYGAGNAEDLGLLDVDHATVEVTRDSMGAATTIAVEAGPAGPSILEAARDAFVDGMSAGTLAAAAVAVLGAIAGWRSLPARSHVAAPRAGSRPRELPLTHTDHQGGSIMFPDPQRRRTSGPHVRAPRPPRHPHADGSPQASCVYVTVDGDDIVSGHLADHLKLRNVRRDRRVALAIEAAGDGLFTPYLAVTGTARVEVGGAPEVLRR